ncbi:MAG: HAD family hydrolase [Deltaproteobacteria bacterium]|nr:HAD family hydrolase [Deltaproteobacteria bacterium]
MIRAIVFDFGQTLVDSADGFRTAEKEAQRKACTALGVPEGEAFLAVYREIRSRFHARSDFSRKRILEELFRHYGRKPDSALLERWETEYWEKVKAMTRVFPEAEAVLTVLRVRYRLALITNAQGQTETGKHRLGNYPGLMGFFAVIVVAGEGGIPAKPDPLPFRRCLDQLGIAPGEAVYVGDDWRIDVCGSEAVGMHPVWLRHRLLRRNWPQVKTAAPVIDSLERLLDIERLIPGGGGNDHAGDKMGFSPTASQFQRAVSQRMALSAREINVVMAVTEIDRIMVTNDAVKRANGSSLTSEQKRAFRTQWRKTFEHRWQLEKALAEASPEWRAKPGDKEQNKEVMRDLDYVYRLFRASE